MGDITALLGRADELFDRGITEVQERQRRVRRVGAFPLGRLVFFLVLVSRRWLDLARHSYLPDVRARTSITTPPPLCGETPSPESAWRPEGPADSAPCSLEAAA